jgi:aminoglycoside phosphotransferase (APT) family kinase protein
MTVETVSDVLRQAGKLSRDGENIVGPLKGYHHETYAFPLPSENELSTRFGRGKLRVPRDGLLWFDRRCFRSEDLLLTALHGRIERIPEIVEVGKDKAGKSIFLQGFIEGTMLDGGEVPSRPLSGRYVLQLGRFFRELVSIEPKELEEPQLGRICAPEDRPQDGDTATFLDRLIMFTESQVYQKHGKPYHGLFKALGIDAGACEWLRERTGALRQRPFSLIHGDLHRKNLIVDGAGDLWVIDWELAMIGDPLYDLATHLHLMRYPRRERRRVTDVWQQSVERARAGSSFGWQDDLPLLLAYKRVQSVYTDVIRTALSLEEGREPSGDLGREQLFEAARRIRLVIAAAREPFGLSGPPSMESVMSAYCEWLAVDELTSSTP